MSLTNKVLQFNENSDLIDRWVNGDKNTEVQTAGGPVPSVAKLADGIQTRLGETIDQQRVLEQRLGANTGAGLVKTSSGKTVQEELGAKANINGSTGNDFYARTVQTGGANTLTVAGSATTPTITAAGTGTDINIDVVAKGGGRTVFRNSSGLHFSAGGYGGTITVVNSLRVYGGPTGANPTLFPEGNDANIGLDFTARGSGEFIYRSNGGIQFAVGNAANTVNYLRVIGGASGSATNLNAQGNDANIGIIIQPKGLGSVILAPNGSISFTATAVANAVNYVQASGAIAGAAPVLAAVGSSANIDLNLNAKGTGVIRPGSDLRTANNIIIDAGGSERRVQFTTGGGTLAYQFARNSDGAVGLYDATGGNNVTAWMYTPSTKTLTLGGIGVLVTVPTAPLGSNNTQAVNTAHLQAALANSSSGAKTGDVVMSMRTDFVPPGWLPCNGSSYLRSSYPALSAILGSAAPDFNIAGPTQNTPRHITFSPDGSLTIIGGNQTPYCQMYTRAGNIFTSQYFGSVASVAYFCCAFNPEGDYFVAGMSNTPFVRVYSKQSNGTFRDVALFANAPSIAVNGVAFSPDGNHLALAHIAATHILLYKKSGASFTGIAITRQAGIDMGNDVAFNPVHRHLVIAGRASSLSSNPLAVYKRDDPATDTYTLLTVPRPSPSALEATSISFTADGKYMAVGLLEAGGIAVYRVDGDQFTLLQAPTLPSYVTQVRDVAFSPNGNYLAVSNDVYAATGNTVYPKFTLYKRYGDSFTALNPPAEFEKTGFNGYCVEFSKDSNTLFVGTNRLDTYTTGNDDATMFRTPKTELAGTGIVGFIKT